MNVGVGRFYGLQFLPVIMHLLATLFFVVHEVFDLGLMAEHAFGDGFVGLREIFNVLVGFIDGIFEEKLKVGSCVCYVASVESAYCLQGLLVFVELS